MENQRGPPGPEVQAAAAGARVEAIVRGFAPEWGPRRPSHSTRDGHRPQAEAHVGRYLYHAVLGFRMVDLAALSRLSRSGLYKSVQLGKALVAARRAAGGFGPRPPPTRADP